MWGVTRNTVKRQALALTSCVLAAEQKIMAKLIEQFRSGAHPPLDFALVATMFDETQDTVRTTVSGVKHVGLAALADGEVDEVGVAISGLAYRLSQCSHCPLCLYFSTSLMLSY